MKETSQIKKMIKDTLILFVITLVAGAALGVVYEVTKKPIADQETKAKNEACASVFESAAAFEAYDAFDAEAASALLAENGFMQQDIEEVMTALDKNNTELGYVITVNTHEGYGGDIIFSMGVAKDGTLNGISILSISETAGLGMKAKEPEFMEQWKNKKVTQFAYTKSGAASEEEIDAISGATITTNAVTNGVNAGLIYFASLEGGSLNE